MTKNVKSSFLSELEKTLPPERVTRARMKADKAIFDIKLKNLRKELGITQNKVENFSQSSVSKIENKKDMKISTLITYLDSIGAAIEINVFPKNPEQGKNKSVTILRTLSPQEPKQPTPKKSGSLLKSPGKVKIEKFKVKANLKNKQAAKKHS